MAIDYTQFRNGTDASPFATSGKWWTLEEQSRPSALFGVVKYLQENQTSYSTQILTSARLYGNLSILGLNGVSYSKQATTQSGTSGRITYNVCQSAVDTVVSKMAKNKPRPMFVTTGGDYKKQRKARKLTQFSDGLFYENKAYELGREIFRDAAIWGTGIAFVYPNHSRLCYERVLPTELTVDDIDAFYGKPRILYRTKAVDRSVLIAQFPDYEKDINLCDAIKAEDLAQYRSTMDQVAVVEAWHLPSGPDAKDGLHTISIANKELFSEDYHDNYFPFVFLHWSKRLFGFWGQGGVEQIQNIQLEINKLLWVVQRSMHLAGSFKILLENGSKIVKSHLNNEIGTVINYSGTPPQYVTPPIVPPEIYTHLESLKAKAYEQFGISQLSASSKKPDGLNSGKALREYNDIESDRFMTIGLQYEEFFVNLATLSIKMMKKVYKGRSYKVQVPSSKFLDTIDWADVNMPEDEFVVQCFPTSGLSQNPAERFAEITERMQAGLIDPETGRRLLDMPDLQEEESLANAPTEYLHKIFDQFIEDGKYTSPEPFDNLEKGHKLALEYYAKYKAEGLEEGKLELFRTFISQIEMIMQQAQPPVAPAQPGGITAPQANPEPAPVSPMIPNVPSVA